MADLLKNTFSPAYFFQFSAALKKNIPSFKEKTFLKQVFSPTWESMELKERMRHASLVLNDHIPGDFTQQCPVLIQTLRQLRDVQQHRPHLADLVFPDFIEVHGTAHPEISLDAMEIVTSYISCEFAVRPFLKNHQEMVMKRMLVWAKHPHDHVRRFSSEGCRPRLPWAMAIPALKKDPTPVLEVLEHLKADSSLFVRKSVANNINDIAKDHPAVVKDILQKWSGFSTETDWILKHGSRTLLKKGDPDALAFFGWGGNLKARVLNLGVSRKKLPIGEDFTFSFSLELNGKKKTPVRLEFAIYYMKSNGTQRKKIFQLAQQEMAPGVHSFQKKMSFHDLTTRKHYSGEHHLGIVVNGKELSTVPFLLTKQAGL